MTPARLEFLTAYCPTDADFTRFGSIIPVADPTPPRSTIMVYERKMFLDGFTSMNKVLGPGPNAQPAPEPVRHYEIWCEDTIIRSGSY